MTSTYPPILVVEDDDSHVLLVRHFLRAGGVVNPVPAMSDALEAVRYVRGDGPYADRARHPLPALVLTDLHVGSASGLDVIAGIRDTPAGVTTPIVVLSGSSDGDHIERAYTLGVDAYLVKPVGFDALLDVVRRLALPWALLARRGGSRRLCSWRTCARSAAHMVRGTTSRVRRRRTT